MAKKSTTNDDTKTVSGTLKNGTRVTVSEELSKTLRGFTADSGSKRTSSSSS